MQSRCRIDFIKRLFLHGDHRIGWVGVGGVEKLRLKLTLAEVGADLGKNISRDTVTLLYKGQSEEQLFCTSNKNIKENNQY